MKILLMTDMEGVAGVKNFRDFCHPESPQYDKACRMETAEVNAAIDGFFAGGASYIQVADGHGPGGIDLESLDGRAAYADGWHPVWPFELEESYDGIAWVGQHAKASSEYAHLCHTQNLRFIDLTVNSTSLGEFGQMAYCAAELGVSPFFASGDDALAEEAAALVPGIVTCPVKRGVMPGTGAECTVAEYERRNEGALHVAPQRASAMIRKAAEASMWGLKRKPPRLEPLGGPYLRRARFRPENKGEPESIAEDRHESSFIELMRMPYAVEK
jgi:D-amino peptidase